MNIHKFIIFIWAMLLGFATAAPATPETPAPPAEDDFYNPPSGFESAKVGEVLRMRKSPYPLRSFIVKLNIKNSWQLLVRLEDGEGNPLAIVTTIVEPYNADNEKVVSYQIAQDSSSSQCAISYSIAYGAPIFENLEPQAEMLIVQVALNAGWWVILPDYEGPNNSFCSGRTAGKSTINSLRGVMNSLNETGISEDAKYVVWGYSGGTIASGWLGALQPTYAPELKDKILGIAMGGFVVNITNTIYSVDNTLYQGLVPNGIRGLANDYPVIWNYVDKYINDKYVTKFNESSQKCLVGGILECIGSSMLSGKSPWFHGGFGLLEEPEVKEVLYRVTLATNSSEIPEIPLFVYHGTNDSIVPFVNSQTAYDTWCSEGINSFELNESLHTRHITEMFDGLPAAFTWLLQRFEGKEVVKGCQHNVRKTNLLYPGISKAVLDEVLGIEKTLFGSKVGPSVNSTIAKRELGYYDYDDALESFLIAQRQNMMRRGELPLAQSFEQ